MAGLSRRALCAGLIAVPAAVLFPNLATVSAQPLAGTASAGAIPPLIRRVVEVVAQHTGVSVHAIMARKGGPEVQAAHRQALFLACNLTHDGKAFAKTCLHLGVSHPWIGLDILRRAVAEIGQDPKGTDTILELAGRVHKDAPAMLLGDTPAYNMEAAFRA